MDKTDYGLRSSVRGRWTTNAPLAASTWFRVGGCADVLFSPADEEDLMTFLVGCPSEVPVTVIGVASNLLIRDAGIRGVVIRLGAEFARTSADGVQITAGAAAIDLNVSRAAADAGIVGLEFMSGIPGTIGGGLRMNAGAYGREFCDVVTNITVIDRSGKRRVINKDDMGFSYRHSSAPDDWIFTAVTFVGQEIGDVAEIQARMRDIQSRRMTSQPIREKTGGSTFANPDSDPHGRKAWQLIDAAGCRGLRRGGAMVSEQHCNFLINCGTATAADLEDLGEDVRRRVFENSGVNLRWEIKRIGERCTVAQ